MAWFKDAEDGSSAPAVTVERIHRALGAHGFEMGPMEAPTKLVAKFDGCVTVLDVSNPTFLMIRAHFPEEFPSESMGELIEKGAKGDCPFYISLIYQITSENHGNRSDC